MAPFYGHEARRLHPNNVLHWVTYSHLTMFRSILLMAQATGSLRPLDFKDLFDKWQLRLRTLPQLDFIENLARSAAEVAVKDWFGAEHFIGPLEGEPELSEVTERAPTAPHVGPVEQLEAI